MSIVALIAAPVVGWVAGVITAIELRRWRERRMWRKACPLETPLRAKLNTTPATQWRAVTGIAVSLNTNKKR